MIRSSALARRLVTSSALCGGGCGGRSRLAAFPDSVAASLQTASNSSPVSPAASDGVACMWKDRHTCSQIHRLMSSQAAVIQEEDHDGDVKQIPLAQPGEGIAECELLSWHVDVGDAVEAFQPLCDVQSDKATVEITSRYAGKILAVHHPPGAMVPVGAALVDIRVPSKGANKDVPPQTALKTGGEEEAKAATASAAPSVPQAVAGGSSSGQIVPVPLAQPGEGIAECELISWHVAVGDTVEAFQPLCEVQSDKATVEITSRFSGKVTQVHHQPGAMVPVGAALVDIELLGSSSSRSNVKAPAPPKAPQAPEAAVSPPIVTAPSGRAVCTGNSGARSVLTSPAVRRLARDTGLDLSTVTGSGPGGRITKADVLAFLETTGTAKGSEQSPADAPAVLLTEHKTSPSPPAVPEGLGDKQHSPTAGLPDALTEGQHVERVPLRGYARAMVKTMTEANQVPHFYFCDEVCMDSLVAIRSRLRSTDPQHARLTYLPFLLKAASLALADFPVLNSQLSQDGAEVLRFTAHNIGVAVATPAGLVVPNVKNVQMKSVQQISEDLLQLQEMAAAGKLTKEHLSHGTITISNIGSIGGTYAMPLVNVPEVAIVALGRARSVVQLSEDGEFVNRTMMNISWGADHRVVDGAALAGFSNRWKSFIEDPEKMMLQLR